MARDGVAVGPELAALVARRAAGERFDVRAACAELGVSRKTFYKYLARFDAEGVDGFYPRSRRPRTSPSRTSGEVEAAVVLARKVLGEDGWDAGAEQIGFWLADHPESWPADLVVPSRATINRILTRWGMVIATPARRPKRSRRRFEADAVNTMWQMDGFVVTLADGTGATVLEVIDDCSRRNMALRAASTENAADAWAALLWAFERYGLPRLLLTDNGTAFSGRRRGWVSNLEENLHALHIGAITSSVGHPQTCGKCERAHGTARQWLAARAPAANLTELQTQLDTYREHYNSARRKTHLNGLTPTQRFELGPLDGPGEGPAPWPVTIRTLTVGPRGCITADRRELGIGRAYTGTTVTMIKQHRDIAVLAGHKLLAEFTITGTARYQSRKQ